MSRFYNALSTILTLFCRFVLQCMIHLAFHLVFPLPLTVPPR